MKRSFTKRTSTIQVKTKNGIIDAVVKFRLDGLTLGEIQRTVDVVSEGVLGALREPPYGFTVPLRNVKLK